MIEGKENSNQSQSTAGVCVEQAKAIRQMPTHSSPSSCLLNKQLSLLVSLPTLPQKCYSNLFKWKQNNKSSNTVMHQLPLLGETPQFTQFPENIFHFKCFPISRAGYWIFFTCPWMKGPGLCSVPLLSGPRQSKLQPHLCWQIFIWFVFKELKWCWLQETQGSLTCSSVFISFINAIIPESCLTQIYPPAFQVCNFHS